MKIQSKINTYLVGSSISNATISSSTISINGFISTQGSRLMDLHHSSTNLIAQIESLKQRIECLEQRVERIDE